MWGRPGDRRPPCAALPMAALGAGEGFSRRDSGYSHDMTDANKRVSTTTKNEDLRAAGSAAGKAKQASSRAAGAAAQSAGEARNATVSAVTGAGKTVTSGLSTASKTVAGAAGTAWLFMKARRVLVAGAGTGAVAFGAAAFTAGRRTARRGFGPLTRATGGRI